MKIGRRTGLLAHLDSICRNPISGEWEDAQGRRAFKFPDHSGVMAFTIWAVNKESADAQYAKIIKKKNKGK